METFYCVPMTESPNVVQQYCEEEALKRNSPKAMNSVSAA